MRRGKETNQPHQSNEEEEEEEDGDEIFSDKLIFEEETA